MTFQDPKFIALTLVCSIAAIGCILYGWRLIKQHRLLQQRLLAALNLELDEARQHQAESASPPRPDAKNAERPKTGQAAEQNMPGPFKNQNNAEAPERYSYVASLLDHGMDAGEIADILKISPTETEQLIKLSKVARKKSRNH